MQFLKHPDHVIARGKTTFLDYDRNFHVRRRGESFYIDMFAKSVLPIVREEISEKN